MDIILGAWGLGALAGIQNKHRYELFKNFKLNGLSIPPMSSIHAGYIEIFPFLFFNKIYIDEKSYRIFLKHGIGDFRLTPQGREILLEFERQGILIPLDYGDILSSSLDQIIDEAEKDLQTQNLNELRLKSMYMWMNFLKSTGGMFHPSLSVEIQKTLNVIKLFKTTPSHELAEIHSALDVYDVNLMVILYRKLKASICDWQMYGPFYESKMFSTIPWMKTLEAEKIHNNFDIFVPVPQKTDIDYLFELRENSVIDSFKKFVRFLNNPNKVFTPDQFIFLRRNLLNIVSTSMSRISINSGLQNEFPIFSENLIETISKKDISKQFDEQEKNSTLLVQIFQNFTKQEMIMGDKFENISNSTIINRTYLVNSIKKYDHDKELVEIIKQISLMVKDSGNKEAIESLDDFNEELSKKEPRKSKLKSYWNSLIAILPNILTITNIADKITKLVS